MSHQTDVSDSATCEVCGEKAVKHCSSHKDYCAKHWYEHLNQNPKCFSELFSETFELIKEWYGETASSRVKAVFRKKE